MAGSARCSSLIVTRHASSVTPRRVSVTVSPRRKGVLISESQCRVVVARIRAEIAAEVGTPVKVFVPQTRLPGAEGEVDWG